MGRHWRRSRGGRGTALTPLPPRPPFLNRPVRQAPRWGGARAPRVRPLDGVARGIGWEGNGRGWRDRLRFPFPSPTLTPSPPHPPKSFAPTHGARACPAGSAAVRSTRAAAARLAAPQSCAILRPTGAGCAASGLLSSHGDQGQRHSPAAVQAAVWGLEVLRCAQARCNTFGLGVPGRIRGSKRVETTHALASWAGSERGECAPPAALAGGLPLDLPRLPGGSHGKSAFTLCVF